MRAELTTELNTASKAMVFVVGSDMVAVLAARWPRGSVVVPMWCFRSQDREEEQREATTPRGQFTASIVACGGPSLSRIRSCSSFAFRAFAHNHGCSVELKI
ncbi:hypothetical protein L3X38_026477 [Prunus dulcis]|uniref:Uncharacterized protein n=1 Tax=Prunus dulcis TaxID=3755 RepID=A0AAD4YZC6_PRUDU|nr:hypothetical protein L3X38_026477 [Prunus dulcis]